MTNLSAWDRPHYQPAEQCPFVFLAAFGADPNAHPLSRSTFQCSGIPSGLDLQGYTTAGHPGYLEDLRSGYLWDDLSNRDAGLASSVLTTSSVTVLAGEVSDPTSLLYLRDLIGIGEWLFACGARAIFDPQAFTWWSRDTWHNELFAAGRPQPHKHVQILESEDNAGLWYHTRGMRLFGRPDISLRQVSDTKSEIATTLINRLIAFQALGGVIMDGQEFTMAGLPGGISCRQTGSLEDPDFNNFHTELVWPA